MKGSRVQISDSALKVSNLQKCDCWLFCFNTVKNRAETGSQSKMLDPLLDTKSAIPDCLRNTQVNENQGCFTNG